MSTTFDEFLAEQLKDPEFKKEYDALEPEFAIIQAMIDARKESGLTQKELSERIMVFKTLVRYVFGAAVSENFQGVEEHVLRLLCSDVEIDIGSSAGR